MESKCCEDFLEKNSDLTVSNEVKDDPISVLMELYYAIQEHFSAKNILARKERLGSRMA